MRPVGLDDVRHHGEQRVGVRGLRGEQRLGGLAQAGLVGEQEGAVAGLRRRRPPRPGAASAPGRRAPAGRPARAASMQDEAPLPALLERRGTAGRAAPSVASARGWTLRRRGVGEVGGEEGVGQLPRDDRLRHDPALGGGGGRCGSAAAASSGAARPRPSRSISRLSDLAASETTASSASSSSSEVSRAAVFARIVAMPSRRLSCSARWASVISLSALTRARSSRTSRATTWNFVRTDGTHGAALDARLDLAHGAGEHRDDALVVALADAPLVPRGRTASARLALCLVEPQTPPLEYPARSRAPRHNIRTQPWPPRPGRRAELPGEAAPRRDAVPRICKRSTWHARRPSTLRNLRPPGGGPSTETEMRSLWTSGIPRVGAAPILARNLAPSGERPGDWTGQARERNLRPDPTRWRCFSPSGVLPKGDASV